MMIAGLIVGLCIGCTGVGGGSLMSPILMFFGINPAIVVGSDLGYSLLTKILGSGVHMRNQTVKWRWVWMLALGSVPGAIIGSLLIGQYMHSPALIRKFMGGALIFSTTLILAADVMKRRGSTFMKRMQQPKPVVVSLIGLVIGLLLGSTSVGSGVLADVALLLFSPLSGLEVVGTGLAHGVLITIVAATVHWKQGTIDTLLVLNLLCGSLPGVWIGSYLATRLSPQRVRFCAATLILMSGVILIA